jgi:methylase of polypeptide subunit release factors
VQVTLDDDDATIFRINAFDWNQAFPSIMQAGGFDAVIGNPPYVRIRQ